MHLVSHERAPAALPLLGGIVHLLTAPPHRLCVNHLLQVSAGAFRDGWGDTPARTDALAPL
eukprot:1175599-Prorocentrum_minimum.AAC.7